MTPTINSVYKIMVLHVPEIPPKVTEIVTLYFEPVPYELLRYFDKLAVHAITSDIDNCYVDI